MNFLNLAPNILACLTKTLERIFFLIFLYEIIKVAKTVAALDRQICHSDVAHGKARVYRVFRV